MTSPSSSPLGYEAGFEYLLHDRAAGIVDMIQEDLRGFPTNVYCDKGPTTPEEAVERLADAGFSALDFNFCDWVWDGSPFLEEGWRRWLEKIRAVADRRGIPFSQAHAPLFKLFEDSETNLRMTELSRRSVEAAAILGIHWMAFHTESRPGAFDKEHVEQLRDENIRWFSEKILPTAERAGVGIALENTTDAFASDRDSRRLYGSTPEELAQIVDGIGHPLAGVCWDTGHAALQRLEQATAIVALGHRLKALHVQDNDGREDQHLPPFCGCIEWTPILKALKRIGYRGDFTFEIHNFTRRVPDGLRDDAVRYAAAVGAYLLEAYHAIP